ncbi:MAG: M4 family metallopeptidase [Anaerolineales bacterium]
MPHSSHFLCITPPHILRAIAANGSPAQRQIALQTLTASEQFRGQRTIMREVLSFLTMLRAEGKQRFVYDAHYSAQLPGALVRQENQPEVDDPAVNEAYDGSGATYDLFAGAFGRNSIDNRGMRLDSTVHYQQGYDNAFWNGEQMVYGDGDEDLPEEERLFNRFTSALDVIGHELTHGVTQFEANLAYWEQSGALNESISDVFGSLVKQFQRRQSAADADWIIGEGLFTANVHGAGIRSMKAPGTAYDDPILGKDPQPAHMRDYVTTADDNGGVHINSGIPNHAFYVTAIEIGGFAWERAGRVWYKALTDKLSQRATFQQTADLTFEAAGELFGTGSLEQKAVKTGWAEVGINMGGQSQEGCLTALMRQLSLIR